MDSDGGMNHIAPLRCWTKGTVKELPGEAECEKSRGSDLGLGGGGSSGTPKIKGFWHPPSIAVQMWHRAGGGDQDQPVHAAI